MDQRSRSYRRHHRRRVIANRRRFLLAREGESGILSVRPDGKMAERHPYDCGKRCFMCHGDKLLDHGTRRLREGRVWQAVEVAAWEGDEAPLDVTEFEQHEFVYDERGFCMTPPPIEYAGVWSQNGHRLGDLSDIDTHYVTGQKIYEVEDDYGYRWWVNASDHYIR